MQHLRVFGMIIFWNDHLDPASRNKSRTTWLGNVRVLDCWTRDRQIVGSNLGRSYYTSKAILSLPSLPGSVNE